MTDVTNLATGQVKTYDLPAKDALRAAYAQGSGDFNTWDYKARAFPPFTTGKRTIALGDWCVKVASA